LHLGGHPVDLLRREVTPALSRAILDASLTEEIQRGFEANYRVYGVRKIYHQLHREGRIWRLMGEAWLQGARRGKPKFTTRPDHSAIRPPDLVERDFTAAAPNRLWVADFTYVRTWQGFAYVSFVEDVFSRMIVGWSIATHMRSTFVTEALEMAVWKRQCSVEGLVHHSDAGSQYTSVLYSEQMASHGIAPSIGSVGDSYDNAMAESGIGLYKSELVWRQGPWRTTDQLEIATLEYVDWFNYRRLHGEIGHVPPAEFEQMFHDSHQEAEIEG
jgi:putative transposase